MLLNWDAEDGRGYRLWVISLPERTHGRRGRAACMDAGTIDVTSAAGNTLARHRLESSGAHAIVRASEHVAAPGKAVLASTSDTGAPCRRNPPDPKPNITTLRAGTTTSRTHHRAATRESPHYLTGALGIDQAIRLLQRCAGDPQRPAVDHFLHKMRKQPSSRASWQYLFVRYIPVKAIHHDL